MIDWKGREALQTMDDSNNVTWWSIQSIIIESMLPSQKLAKEEGLDEDVIAIVDLAATLHDVQVG